MFKQKRRKGEGGRGEGRGERGEGRGERGLTCICLVFHLDQSLLFLIEEQPTIMLENEK